MPPPHAHLAHRPSHHHHHQRPILIAPPRHHHHRSLNHHHDRHHHRQHSFTTQIRVLTTLTSDYTRLITELNALQRENGSLGSSRHDASRTRPPSLTSAIDRMTKAVVRVKRRVREASEKNRVLRARGGRGGGHGGGPRGDHRVRYGGHGVGYGGPAMYPFMGGFMPEIRPRRRAALWEDEDYEDWDDFDDGSDLDDDEESF